MKGNVKNLSRLLIGNEDGFGWTIVFIVVAVVAIAGGAIYGGVQAGGAMGNYSRSSHQAEEAFSSPDTPDSQETLEEIQHTHSQGGLPVMTPVLEAGIRAQGAGGPQGFGISYTIGRWIASIIEWATGSSSEPPKNSQTTPAVTGEDLNEHTNVTNTTDDAAGAGGGSSSSSGSGGGGCVCP
jgi:hypothetical protein